MNTFVLQRKWGVLGFLVLVAALTGAVWQYGYGRALDQLARRGEADLALASDRLGTQLQRYQELAVLMADHPAMRGLDDPARRGAATALLLEVADKTGALDVMFARADGQVLASAHGRPSRDLSQTAFFRRAMHGALGNDQGIRRPLDLRAYYYAAPAFGPDGRVDGVLVVAVNVEDFEKTWRGSTPAVFFTDRQGEVFISNRSELLFWQRPVGEPGLIPTDGRELPFRSTAVGGHEIWSMNWGPYLPEQALHLVRSLPIIGLTGEVLVSVQPALDLAFLQAAAVAAICLAFGAMLFLATERRRTLARANLVLESRVAKRTRALSGANDQLRREIRERQEAEAALKKAQSDLVQAGKLSALGQMSAGISHELNQPLMAIQSFAENGTQYLKRGQVDVAAGNLARISDMARRMGRIIKNLRAFARQETEAAGQVDVVATLESALELTQTRLAHDQVTLNWAPPPMPIWVKGGEVRLGQVFVNLVNNAADAMVGQAEKSIAVSVQRLSDRVVVEVADNGPGIEAPEKIFEPFYTTKEVGASEGMGLGLSISYGLVQSFGGVIRGRNRASGGAVLTVELAPWTLEAVA
jgi:two-component system C4-dicarboxylate transport sensor histidine kinase DctB